MLIDESEGRSHATALGIPVVGTVGVLLRAKRDGAIPKLAPILNELVQHHGFRLRASVIAKALDAAGEAV